MNEVERIMADVKRPNGGSPAVVNDRRCAARRSTLDLGGGEKLELVYVSPGEFRMGNDEAGIPGRPKAGAYGENYEGLFTIGKYPITVGPIPAFRDGGEI